jgi:hypothetical protein
MKKFNKTFRPSEHGIYYYCPNCYGYILEKNIGSGITCPYCKKWISSTDIFIDWNTPSFAKSIRQSIIDFLTSERIDKFIEFMPNESRILEIIRKFNVLSDENLTELFEKAEYMVSKTYDDYSFDRMLSLMVKLLYESEEFNDVRETK